VAASGNGGSGLVFVIYHVQESVQITNATIPNSAILYGPASITLTDQLISALTTGTAEAWYFLTAAGLVQQSTQVGGINPSTLENWCIPANQAQNYEARVTVTAGALTGGTTNTWLALSSTRSWYLSTSGSGQSDNCILTVEIRRVGTTNILDSATIDLVTSVL
jgi:hypothetical protein